MALQTRRPRADADRLAQLYEERGRALLAFFARRALDPEVALDLVAETFAQAYASRHRLRGSTEDELAGWLFGIANHLLARYLRRGKLKRRAIGRLGIQIQALSEDDHARIEELAGLREVRSAVAERSATWRPINVGPLSCESSRSAHTPTLPKPSESPRWRHAPAFHAACVRSPRHSTAHDSPERNSRNDRAQPQAPDRRA